MGKQRLAVVVFHACLLSLSLDCFCHSEPAVQLHFCLLFANRTENWCRSVLSKAKSNFCPFLHVSLANTSVYMFQWAY